MLAGYVRVWRSMEEAIDHVAQVAKCSKEEARDALVQAILDGEVGSRFGDNGLQEIKPFLWQSAKQWAPYSGFGGRPPNRVRISGEAAYLRPFFDPPADPALLPERLRPVEVRHADVEALWPAQPPAKRTKASAASEHIARVYPDGIPAGMTDKALAREIGVSDRTVRRARTGKR